MEISIFIGLIESLLKWGRKTNAKRRTEGKAGMPRARRNKNERKGLRDKRKEYNSAGKERRYDYPFSIWNRLSLIDWIFVNLLKNIYVIVKPFKIVSLRVLTLTF